MPLPTELYQTEYGNNLIHRYQQSKSRLMPFVQTEEFSGERKDYPRIGASADPVNITLAARGSDTPYNEADFDKRWAYPSLFEKSTHFAQWDAKLLGAISLPDSDVQQNHIKAFMRQYDKEIVAAALGNVLTGKLGTVPVALPAGQKIAAGGTGMSLAKLISALDILDAADEDAADDGTLEKVFCWTVKQRNALLNNTQVTSSDFATVKALAEGRIESFMGFKFKLLQNALPLAAGVRSCVAFRQGALRAIKSMKPSSVAPRLDKRNALQVYDTGAIGVCRVHDEGVVQIDCTEV